MPPDLFVETAFISFESMSSKIHGSAITFVTYSSNSMQQLNIFSRKLSKNSMRTSWWKNGKSTTVTRLSQVTDISP